VHVIAHRGASGYLPEHSLVAKALAHGQGADFLEQDVVATRDGALIVCHDTWLDAVTDVAVRFPGRARADGRNYAIDFTLAEVRTLRLLERVRPETGDQRFPGRFGRTDGAFGIPTFAEELRFIAGLNRTTGRRVGVYPEIKDPGWHRAHGIELAGRVLAELAEHWPGDGGAFVQCFDGGELRRLAESRPPWPLVQLVDGSAGAGAAAALVAGSAAYAQVVGLDLRLLLCDSGPALVASARAAGLGVHAWTARKDALPPGFPSLDALLDALAGPLAVDGIFTDFPDLAVAWRAGR
jgi:glycerophosphoryl diester phosphodiesterase